VDEVGSFDLAVAHPGLEDEHPSAAVGRADVADEAELLEDLGGRGRSGTTDSRPAYGLNTIGLRKTTSGCKPAAVPIRVSGVDGGRRSGTLSYQPSQLVD
jgi:hypothetical protein